MLAFVWVEEVDSPDKDASVDLKPDATPGGPFPFLKLVAPCSFS